MHSQKQITDFIPEDVRLVLVQAKIPEDVVKRVREKLARERITWRTFLTACFEMYLSEGRPQEGEKEFF